MEYYLQVLIGGLVLIAVTIPLSDNYKQIKVKNIFFAILIMFVFAFILATIPSFHGYYMKGGALEVGKASTIAFVWTSVVIILLATIFSTQ